MMESNAESSCKGQEDGDGSCSERPLKKARYAWQVKGKHHLKSEGQESNKKSTSPSNNHSPETIPEEPEINDITVGTDTENYFFYQESNQLESVIENPENSLLTPNRNVNSEKYIYPKYTSSDRNDTTDSDRMLSNRSKTESQFGGITEDQCIAQWQARQMVKGCVDNTINRLLESYPQAPMSLEDNSRLLALDFAEFINHLPGDNTVENEGILMAISAHGLQNTPSSSSDDASSIEDSPSSLPMFDLPSSLESFSTDQVKQPNKSDEEKSKDDDLMWHCDNSNDNDVPYPYYNDPINYPFYQENKNQKLDGNENDNQYDFMNAAVLFAIKSKGLTAAGTDYG